MTLEKKFLGEKIENAFKFSIFGFKMHLKALNALDQELISKA